MRWLNLVFVLLVNAVPLYGIKYLGWSIGTVLLLYWVENVLVTLFTCARIALHRALTRKSGHWRTGSLGVLVNGKPSTRGLLGEYATMAIGFTLAHGIFVYAIVFLFGEGSSDPEQWRFSFEQFRFGALQMIGLMSFEFLLDAAQMRSRNFAWIKTYVQQRMGRVLVLHLAIIFGMMAMVATESPVAVLYVLIGLKTLWDLAAAASSAKADSVPENAPQWVGSFADKVASQHGGAAKIQADWKRARDDLLRAAREDEQVRPA